MERLECAVVGGGVVGLAIARALAQAGREVVILEAEDAYGTMTSARNSEVIHAGIYYPTDSLKARLCVSGKHALYDFARSHGVKHQQCGKLIVATSANEVSALETLKEKASANGVGDLEWLTGSDVATLEPEVQCHAALLSPSTGIIDSHGLMLALLGDAEEAGAMLALNAPVTGGSVRDNGGVILEVGGDTPMTLSCDLVINTAGLGAQSVSRQISGLPTDPIPPQHFAKGNYFILSGKNPFSRLIYPAPEAAGLGVHVTIDLGGQCRFGPDVEWVDEVGYEVDPRRGDVFYDAVRRYWPGLPDDSLLPGYAGIRPKLQAPGEAAKDFMIQSAAETGVEGYIALYGIESPGLTSCLAIADHVLGLTERAVSEKAA